MTNKELVLEIVEKVATGRSVRSIIMGNKDKYPTYKTFMNHVNKDDEVRKAYVEACSVRADIEFDKILDIADEDIDHNDSTAVQRNKLRIDARKWVLSRMKPKKYGDKLDLNHGGQEGNPVIERIERVIVKPKTNDAQSKD